VALLAPHTRWLRSFACTEGHELIPAVAREHGLKTMVGAWISHDRERNEREIHGLVTLAKAGLVDIAVVGNEVLLRDELPEPELLAYIQRVKAAVPEDVRVACVDAYYLFLERPALTAACDVLLASPSARFADTHARIGIAPGWGLSQKLSRAIGPYRAREVSFTGNWVGAEQAAAWGFVNRVVPADELLGTACAMAAGAAAQLLGGSVRQIEYAAEMGLEHHLGLTCDPIGGYVQIPCIERNAIGAVRAVDCAAYALLSDGHHIVPFDEVVRTMWETGCDMKASYRETAQGGLAKVHLLRKHGGGSFPGMGS
jgi:hypothetical protein